jgi:hypothetical protein
MEVAPARIPLRAAASAAGVALVDAERIRADALLG